MDNVNVADIIQQAFQGRPQGVEDAFNNVIQQKMANAIDAHRQEIAQNMFGSEEEVEDTDINVEPDIEETEELDQVEVEEPTDEDV